MPDWQELGRRIRNRRRRLGLTQEELGERAGLHYSYVGQVERGDKTPSLRALNKLATALGMPLEALLEEGPSYEAGKPPGRPVEELAALLKGRPPEDQRLILALAELVLQALDDRK